MKRDALISALERVKPGLSSKENNIEQSTSFAFIDGRICTYNDEISVSTQVEGLNITGAVKSDELYKLLGKLKADDISIETNESEVILTSGRTKAGFTLQQEIKLPIDQIGNVGKWSKLPDNFMSAIEFTMVSCAKDMSRPVLTCVNIREDGCFESSDNYRISRYKLEKMPVKTFLLPATTASILVKFNVAEIAEGQNWVHFRTEDQNTQFSCRVFEDNFPNIDSVLQVDGKQIELPVTMQEVLDRAVVFCTQEKFTDQNIVVTVSDKRLKVRAESNTSWLEEEVNMPYRGEQIKFAINPHLLKAILAQTRVCVVGERCLKFTGENWQHVVALVV